MCCYIDKKNIQKSLENIYVLYYIQSFSFLLIKKMLWQKSAKKYYLVLLKKLCKKKFHYRTNFVSQFFQQFATNCMIFYVNFCQS